MRTPRHSARTLAIVLAGSILTSCAHGPFGVHVTTRKVKPEERYFARYQEVKKLYSVYAPVGFEEITKTRNGHLYFRKNPEIGVSVEIRTAMHSEAQSIKIHDRVMAREEGSGWRRIENALIESLDQKSLRAMYEEECTRTYADTGAKNVIRDVVTIHGMRCLMTSLDRYQGMSGEWSGNGFYYFDSNYSCPLYIGDAPSGWSLSYSFVIPEKMAKETGVSIASIIRMDIERAMNSMTDSLQFHVPVSGWIADDTNEYDPWCGRKP